VAIVDPSTTEAIYRAAWVDDVDLNDDGALMAALNRAGHDGAALIERTQDPAIKAVLRANTEAATTAGACGAPTIAVGERLFWGQDRLNRVAESL
jgi:2-hydroxychromene-2-carboxylate isomerase